MSRALRWLLAVFVSAATAAKPAVESWQVRAEVAIVHLGEDRALPLIAQFTDDAPRAGAELERLLAGGEAKAVAYLTGRTESGGGCTVGQTENKRYATKYSPIDPRIAQISKFGPGPKDVGHFITSFEQHECGHMAELQVLDCSSKGTVHLVLCVKSRVHSATDRIEGGVRADGAKTFCELPVFTVRETMTSHLAKVGIPILVGSYKLASQPNTFELHVLTVRTRLLDGLSHPQPVEWHPVPLLFDGQFTITARPDWQTSLELHKFVVPQAEALALRPLLLDASRMDTAFTRLLALVRAGRGELMDCQSLCVGNGSRGWLRNFRGQLFGTEPPPRSPPGGNASLVVVPKFPPWIAHDNPPIAYEKRDVGNALETEATTSPDGTRIELQIAFETVGHHGFWRWSTGANKELGCVQTYSYRPDFLERKTSTKVSLANGRREMLSFNKLQGSDDRVEIAVIRAVSVRVPSAPKPE